MADRHAADVGLGRQERLQRYGRGNLAHPDQASRRLEDGLMQRFEKVFGFKEIRHPVEGVVVDEDRAQQSLFRFDVVRSGAVGRCRRIGRKLENVRISQCHGQLFFRVLVRSWDRGRDKAPVSCPRKGRVSLLPDSHNPKCDLTTMKTFGLTFYSKAPTALRRAFGALLGDFTGKRLNLHPRKGTYCWATGQPSRSLPVQVTSR